VADFKVALEVIEQSEELSFTIVVRKAKAVAQITVFSLTLAASVQRKLSFGGSCAS
jgi:hypothetical protein